MSTEDYDEDDSFIGSFAASIQHGLLILRDVQSVDTHRDWDGSETVDAKVDSLYLRVQPSADGMVAVEVFGDGSGDLALEEFTLFEGAISSEHGEFILHDPNNWISMRVVTDEPGAANLRISADDDSMPANVRIQIWY